MEIDERLQKLGFNEDIIKELHCKTKFSEFEIKSIKINQKRNELFFLDIEIDTGPTGKFYTLHTTFEEILILKRDILINKILE
jgi:hypothetical protein